MKLVIAYIRPRRLNAVKQALFNRDVLKISVSNALGCGDEPGYYENYRGAGAEVDLRKRIRLEIAVNEPYVDKVIEAICEGARTESVGDGKIFVIGLERCVRIRTGETGDEAIG